MNDLTKQVDFERVKTAKDELYDSFINNLQGRSQYQLENFVVGMHNQPERQFSQISIELQHKYYNIRRADINRRKLLNDLEKEQDPFKIEEMELDLEQMDIAIIGALREFDYLYKLFQQYPKYTAEQIEAAEHKYWVERLAIQAQIDIEAHGRIGTGNMEALRQAKMIQGQELRFFEATQGYPGMQLPSPDMLPDSVKALLKPREEEKL
jgi:hypothetical protein